MVTMTFGQMIELVVGGTALFSFLLLGLLITVSAREGAARGATGCVLFFLIPPGIASLLLLLHALATTA